MSPNLRLQKGGAEIGEDMDERQGIETGRGAGPGEARRVKAERGGAGARHQLPPEQADLEALQRGRDKSIEARQRGPGIEPGQASGSSQASAATGARELLRRTARALRAYSGGRAFAKGPRSASIGAGTAALDARRGSVEPPPQAPAASPAAAAQSALRGADPGRRLAPPMARRSRPERLPDELRRRCERPGAVPLLERRDNLGGGRSARSLGASIRRSEGVVLRLEERLQAPADVARSAGRHRARDAVRAHVRPSWGSASSRHRRRKPRAAWSGITAPIKTA